jgi:5-methylcytosine-specific restriction enzyme A
MNIPELNSTKVKAVNKPYGIYDSWEILSNVIAIKTTDKSIFEHHGSGIPKEIRSFWGIVDLEQGEKRQIKLVYQDKEYDAYFARESKETARTRLFWYMSFQEALHTSFPDYMRFDSNTELYPLMRFEKVEMNTYNILFIQPEYVSNDTAAEQEDELIVAMTYEGKKEGQVSYFYSKKYERNPKKRLAAIKIHGCKCACCGFDFEKVYGERGAGFIEIHHNKPLHSLEEEVVVNPETDLSPVCSNCHRIIHRRKNNVLSVEALKNIIKKSV